MAISRLTGQDTSGGATVGGTVTLPYPGATTPNNLLIAALVNLAGSAGSNPSVTTSGWSLAVAGGAISGSSDEKVAIYYKVADGTETSVVGVANTGGSIGMAIFEYTGTAISSVTDGTAAVNSSNSTPETSWTTPNITTTNANDLIFYFVGKGTLSLGTDSWSSGSAVFGQTTTSFLEVVCGQDIVSSTQTNFNDTLTWSGSSQTVSSAIAAFKAASSGSPSPVNFIPAQTRMIYR